MDPLDARRYLNSGVGPLLDVYCLFLGTARDSGNGRARASGTADQPISECRVGLSRIGTLLVDDRCQDST
jgi:hypothetical protein